MSSDFEERAHRWVRSVIRSEMVKRDISFAQLTAMLSAVGHLDEDERNVRNKVARGTFSAAFFAQCMAAMGMKTLNVDLLDAMYADAKVNKPREDRLAAEKVRGDKK